MSPLVAVAACLLFVAALAIACVWAASRIGPDPP